VARSRPLELPQRRLPDPTVGWAEPDGAMREGAPLRRSGKDERDDHESNPPAHRPGLLVTVVLDATSGGHVPAGPRRWVERASPGRACGARTPYRGDERDRLRFRRGQGLGRRGNDPPAGPAPIGARRLRRVPVVARASAPIALGSPIDTLRFWSSKPLVFAPGRHGRYSSARLVPAKNPNPAIADDTTCPFAGILYKPSGGLEPSTPSLPSSNKSGTAGKRGKPRQRRSRKTPGIPKDD
jgi:hypothetical protein